MLAERKTYYMKSHREYFKEFMTNKTSGICFNKVYMIVYMAIEEYTIIFMIEE